MSIKEIVRQQYQDIEDQAAITVAHLSRPPEGWLCTARKALRMTGAQLARRLGVSRAQVSKTEKNELTGSVTLKTMQNMAEAMGCRFVYAIVPEQDTQSLIEQQAQKKAQALVQQANEQMALEAQMLSPQQIQFEITRLQKELLEKMPGDFWDDEK